MKSDSLINFVLRNEGYIRREVAEKRAEQCFVSSSGSGNGTAHSNGISRPTERIALDLAEEIKVVSIPTGYGGAMFRLSWPERWIKVIDTIKNRYKGTVQGELISLHYGKGFGSREVSASLKTSRAMFYWMKNDVISYGEGVATGLGLWTN